MKKRILILTDSRGVHRPAGSTHTVYPLRLAKHPDLEVTNYLCPFQWTTIPDFINLLESREEMNPSRFEKVILHAGIVDHSPRPSSDAIEKLYRPRSVTPSDVVEELFKKKNFTGNKIVNRKKDFFDSLFGKHAVDEHFSNVFDEDYEGHKTNNMYSESMMEESILPRLHEIKNLLFISSNDFCRGWNGDFPKSRPSNIYMIERYSRKLCENLHHVINLHQWSQEQVKEFTCDNLHLSAAGSDWIYLRILEELGLRPRDYLKSRVSVGEPKRKTSWPLNATGRPEDILSIEMKEPTKLTHQQAIDIRNELEGGNAIATLIIGVRFQEGDSSRLDNLNFLLKWIEEFYPKLFDILIVEQDSKSTEDIREKIPGEYRYEFLYNPEAYNRGWLYNVAVKHFTTAKVVAFCDTDILPGDNFLDCIVDCFDRCDAVSPNRCLYYSTEEEKSAVIKTGSYSTLCVTEASLKNPTTMAGGMLVVNREKFIEIGGFEQYVGYGCEDRALDVTLLELLGESRVRMDSHAYFHLHHPIVKSERAYFNDIYAHMVENYGCEYFANLSSTSYIHANCSHSDKSKTAALADARRAQVGDPEMYKRNSYVTVNGLRPLQKGKLIRIANHEPVFPPTPVSLNEYVDREEFLGKYSASWAPPVPKELAGADTEQLAFFYNRFKGKRCFIIGNGPSLNEIDLSLLKDEYTFAVNSFYYKTQEAGFRPTFFVVEDSSVIKENREQIVNYDAPFKFFPSIYKSLHPKKPGTYFFRINRGFYEKSSPNYAIPRFSTDITKQIFCGQSVTYVNLQLAFFMGFTEVFLIGMDFNYVIPKSHKRNGDVLLSDTDDPNHFHKDYFGKGKTWKDPKLDRVLMNYKMARLVYECAGRKIYNATVGGKLEEFERVNYLGLFNGRDMRFRSEALDLSRPESQGVRAAGIMPQPVDSIALANKLFAEGRYDDCVLVCDRLFKERKLRMYKDLADRARARIVGRARMAT